MLPAPDPTCTAGCALTWPCRRPAGTAGTCGLRAAWRPVPEDHPCEACRTRPGGPPTSSDPRGRRKEPKPTAPDIFGHRTAGRGGDDRRGSLWRRARRPHQRWCLIRRPPHMHPSPELTSRRPPAAAPALIRSPPSADLTTSGLPSAAWCVPIWRGDVGARFRTRSGELFGAHAVADGFPMCGTYMISL